ncbi:hypothetical protein Hanom_Chr16g01477591 [Helianthus anomalus]
MQAQNLVSNLTRNGDSNRNWTELALIGARTSSESSEKRSAAVSYVSGLSLSPAIFLLGPDAT